MCIYNRFKYCSYCVNSSDPRISCRNVYIQSGQSEIIPKLFSNFAKQLLVSTYPFPHIQIVQEMRKLVMQVALRGAIAHKSFLSYYCVYKTKFFIVPFEISLKMVLEVILQFVICLFVVVELTASQCIS